jgi:multiple sugar transport system ATP-binding protein
MNQIPCRLSGDGGAVEIDGGPTLPIEKGRMNGAAGELVLGLRPEAFALADEAASPHAFTVDVHFVEPLGSDTLTFFTLGESEVIARLPPLPSIKAGARIGLSVDPEKMHLFDAATEKLIEPAR